MVTILGEIVQKLKVVKLEKYKFIQFSVHYQFMSIPLISHCLKKGHLGLLRSRRNSTDLNFLPIYSFQEVTIL